MFWDSDLRTLAREALIAQRDEMIAKEMAALAACVSTIDAQILILQADGHVIRKILNYFKIIALRQAQAAARQSSTSRIRNIDNAISSLEDAAGSSDYIGGLAEVRVIKQLEMLPDSFVVFSSVHLHADRFLRYRGTPVQTAQLDHVVLGDAGLFVIETKMWSQSTANRDDIHSPFDQVERASLLLLCMLKDQGIDVKVRSLIAAEGALPPAPAWTKAKAFPARGLVDYITYFRTAPMDDHEKGRIHDFLESRTW